MAESTGWRRTRIGDLGRVVTGKTPPTKRRELYGDKYPFITPTDISDGSHRARPTRFLSEGGCRYQQRHLLPANAVCYTCIASVGKICITTEPSFTNQQINSIVVDSSDYDHRFIYHLLRHETERIKGLASGAATPIINKSAFSDIEIFVPPLSTQCKIAAILSAYDDLVENNTRRIAILEDMAQTIYREWFVHFRFPGHEQVAMVDSQLGPIPEGWEVVKLGDIAEINAISIRKNEAPEEINYVNISSVSTGRIEKMELMAFENAPSRARRVVGHGDIIWSTVRPNRRSYCLLLDPVPSMIVSTGFAVITARTVPYTYLYHALTTDEFVEYLTNNATGAAYPAVNRGDFEKADVLLPPSELLALFHSIIVDLFEQKDNLHRKSEVLRRTRALLLPRLISGELDVSELEISGAELDGETESVT